MTSLLREMTKTAETWNGAVSHSTSGSHLLDYFSKCGTYAGRAQSEVDLDMHKIFGENEKLALSIVFGTRLVTRKPEGSEEVQTGFGRRDEFYKSVVWLNKNKPDLLYNNLHLIPQFGSWKDFLNEPLINTLDRNKVFELFRDNLSNDLLKKFLPQMRSKTRSDRDKLRSQWAREFAQFLKITPKEYRKLKSSGAAHAFQRQMSSNQWDKINFNGIPGKAMSNLCYRTGKDGQSALTRHKQDARLLEWVKTQPSVKFNGYPYELTKAALKGNTSVVKNYIMDKQFQNLLEKFGNHSLGNVLAALDTSGSMTVEVVPGISAYDICISMGIVFSSLNTGFFKDHVVSFNNQSTLLKLTGSFVDRTKQAANCGGWGGTNFQSVIDLLVDIRRRLPNIPIEEYPETILVVSDMQFNPSSNGYYTSGWASQTTSETNYETARRKLNAVGLNDVRIIWWYVNGSSGDFPSHMSDKGVYMIGGFDPVNIKSLMGLNSEKTQYEAKSPEETQKNPYDGMITFLSQPIFETLQF